MAKENEPYIEPKRVFNAQEELAKSRRSQDRIGTVAVWLFYSMLLSAVIGLISWLFGFGVGNPPINQVIP